MKADALKGLLAKCADGDEEAYAVLYRNLEKPLYRFIRSKMNDPLESHDLFHITMLEVWKSAGKFEGRSSVKTWVFSIAYRKVMTYYRSKKEVVLSDEFPDVVDDTPTAESCMISAQSAVQVKHCIGTLSQDHRTAIELTFYEDLSYPEISQVLGVAEGTIKTRVFHAKKLLLRCLSGGMKGIMDD